MAADVPPAPGVAPREDRDRGGPADMSLSVRDLATRNGYASALRRAPRDITPAARALIAVHWANWSLIDRIATPALRGRRYTPPDPTAVGIVIRAGTDDVESWSRPDHAPGGPPRIATIAADIADLLRPVADVTSSCWGRDRRLVRAIAAESVVAGVFRVDRAMGRSHTDMQIVTVTRAVADALGVRIAADILRCRPDAGPAVRIPSRRVCCVLNVGTSCHSCPGRPRSGTRTERERATTAWLTSLDAAEFAEETGRARTEA